MTNLLEAIVNLTENFDNIVESIVISNNRATSMGAGLEDFVKNAFANTFSIKDETKKLEVISDVFSFGGAKNKSPDLMLRGGEAFEIKKTESLTIEIQLNSSHPKNRLYSNSNLVHNSCKLCEKWTEREFSYIIGHNPKGTKYLKSIWFIDGEVYAANEENYLEIKNSISEVMNSSGNYELTDTNEIGKIKALDPLKITSLRVRGMWLIQHPYKVFDYVHNYNEKAKFQIFGLISQNKYLKYPEISRKNLEKNEKIKISDIKLKDPNNSVNLIDSKLIYFSVK